MGPTVNDIRDMTAAINGRLGFAHSELAANPGALSIVESENGCRISRRPIESNDSDFVRTSYAGNPCKTPDRIYDWLFGYWQALLWVEAATGKQLPDLLKGE